MDAVLFLAGIEFAVICIWFYYAPIVLSELEDLRSIFSETEEYIFLYQSYGRWMEQFDLRHPGRSRLFKMAYFLLWVLFLFDVWGLTWIIFGKKRSTDDILVLLYEVLVSSLIVLNFSSYYVCIIFVYFLIRVYALGQADKLKGA